MKPTDGRDMRPNSRSESLKVDFDEKDLILLEKASEVIGRTPLWREVARVFIRKDPVARGRGRETECEREKAP